MRQQAIIVFFIISQLILPNNGLTFYEWMERNSYICQDNNSLEPSFLSDEDAIQFDCEALCGNPLLTSQACSRSPSEPNSSPICSAIPEICLLNFIQEFNDEKTFHLLLNPSPMDKELFKTTRSFFIPTLINEPPSDDQDIGVRVVPIEQLLTPTTPPIIDIITTTTTTTVEPRITTIPVTTTTLQPTTTSTVPTTTSTTTTTTTTQAPATQVLTTQTTKKTTTTVKQIPKTTQRPSTNTPRKSKTLIGFRVPINVLSNAFNFQSSTHKQTTTTSPPKIVRDFFINSFNSQLNLQANKPCVDLHVSCEYWTALNECTNNPKYMFDVCRRSCKRCV